MSRNLSPAAIAAANGQQTSEVFLSLLTLSHDDLSVPIRVVNNNQDVVSNGETFIAYPFEITLPSDSADSPPRITLRIDNVDRQIVQTIRSLTSAPTLKMEVVLFSDPDTIEISIDNARLENVQYDALSVTGELAWENILNDPFPFETYTPSTNPSLF